MLTLALAILTGANYSGRVIDVVYAKGIFRDPRGWSSHAGMRSRVWKSTAKGRPKRW